MTDNVVSIAAFTIDQLKHRIIKRWKDAQNAEKKAHADRIQVGLDLLELRARVEGGEVGELATWWEWYEDNIPRHRRDAEKLMAMAKSEDPQAALEADQAAARARMRRLREDAEEPQETGEQAEVRRSIQPNVQPPKQFPKNPAPVTQPTQASAPTYNPDPPVIPVDEAKVEAIIALVRQLNIQERALFATRFRQLIREW